MARRELRLGPQSVVVAAGCGDSGDTDHGAGVGGGSDAASTGAAGSGCMARVEPRDEDGCAAPCLTLILNNGDRQMCRPTAATG